MTFPSIILRHRRENLKKCSLSGLESRSDLLFFTYPTQQLPNLSHYFLLEVGAPILTQEDTNLGIFIIDATWKLAAVMKRQCPSIQTRSLPSHFQTAYPRKQTSCSDPEKGLASVEALFLAHLILNRSTEGLLDHYHWKNAFLEKNDLV